MMLDLYESIIKQQQIQIDQELEELGAAKRNFLRNHEARMKELNEISKRLKDQSMESKNTMDQIFADLDSI